jgi:hypothetical protein
MPAQAGIHLFFGAVPRCLEMDCGRRRNDTGDFGTDQAHRIRPAAGRP